MRKEEISLVKRLMGGDKGAFRWFYRQYQDKLLKFVSGKVSDRRDAEELVQDIWLSFLDALPLFSFRSTLGTFLWAIVHHEVADYYRKRYTKKVIKLVPLVGWIYQERLYSADRVAGELHGVIERAYGGLTPVYRRILQLKYEEEMTVKEIAVKLNMSVKAVESKLFRARRAFQVAYEVVSNG